MGNPNTVHGFSHNAYSNATNISVNQQKNIIQHSINEYLPVHMCPQYILLDNGTEFKNSFMDQDL